MKKSPCVMEMWIDIPGYENSYQVSNEGRVRSLRRIVSRDSVSKKQIAGVIIRPQKCSNGYLSVSLSKNGIVRQHRIHRLVASAFINNPNNYPDVNHINEDKTDNRVFNLEWVSHKQNCRHGTRNERSHAKVDNSGAKNPMFGRTGSKSPQSRPVIQFDANGNIIGKFDNIRIAAEMTGTNVSSISSVLNGRTKTANGFKWQYANNINY